MSEGAGLVEVAVEGRLAVLRLANPARRNVLDLPMATALQESAERLAQDREVRCVILTGTDSTFAAGADIREIESASPNENLAYNRRLRAAVNAVARLPMPTIAAVNGHAIGGGLELACACQLRVVSTEAKLGLPEVRLGIIPATGGLARLPRLIAPGAAAELLLTGDLIDAGRAVELGLANAAVPPGQVLERAREIAARIVTAAPLSARAIVAGLQRDDRLTIHEANLRAEERLARLLATEDRREGARAFLERRPPEFTGS